MQKESLRNMRLTGSGKPHYECRVSQIIDPGKQPGSASRSHPMIYKPQK
ncbi:MAG: hypothetical protein ACM3PY_13925 [Omnitrophica WOR_2 bacterium]